MLECYLLIEMLGLSDKVNNLPECKHRKEHLIGAPKSLTHPHKPCDDLLGGDFQKTVPEAQCLFT